MAKCKQLTPLPFKGLNTVLHTHTCIHTFICSNKHLQRKVAMQVGRTERHKVLLTSAPKTEVQYIEL